METNLSRSLSCTFDWLELNTNKMRLSPHFIPAILPKPKSELSAPFAPVLP